MAESELGLSIPIRFDTTQPEAALDALENRARRGVTIPTRPEGGAGTFASPGGSVSAQVAAARERVINDTHAARPGSIAAQLQGMPGQDPGYAARAARVDRSWDQAAFAQFKAEEKAARASERAAMAEERAAVARERSYSRAAADAGLSGMGPNEQRSELRRMAEEERDPVRRAALTKRANALNRRSGLNTELFGTGQYMNFLFGGWEIAKSYNAASAAERFAAANPQDMQGQLKVWNTAIDQMSGGIIGSVVSMPFQGMRATTEGIAAGAAAADKRMEMVKAFSMEAEDRKRAAFIASMPSDAMSGDVKRKLQELNDARAASEKDTKAKMDAIDIASRAESSTKIAAIEARFKEATTPDPFTGTTLIPIAVSEARRSSDIQVVNTERDANNQIRKAALQKTLDDSKVIFDDQQRQLEAQQRGFRMEELAMMEKAQGKPYAAARTTILNDFQTGAIDSERALASMAALRIAEQQEQLRGASAAIAGYSKVGNFAYALGAGVSPAVRAQQGVENIINGPGAAIAVARARALAGKAGSPMDQQPGESNANYFERQLDRREQIMGRGAGDSAANVSIFQRIEDATLSAFDKMRGITDRARTIWKERDQTRTQQRIDAIHKDYEGFWGRIGAFAGEQLAGLQMHPELHAAVAVGWQQIGSKYESEQAARVADEKAASAHRQSLMEKSFFGKLGGGLGGFLGGLAAGDLSGAKESASDQLLKDIKDAITDGWANLEKKIQN